MMVFLCVSLSSCDYVKAKEYTERSKIENLITFFEKSPHYCYIEHPPVDYYFSDDDNRLIGFLKKATFTEEESKEKASEDQGTDKYSSTFISIRCMTKEGHNEFSLDNNCVLCSTYVYDQPKLGIGSLRYYNIDQETGEKICQYALSMVQND